MLKLLLLKEFHLHRSSFFFGAAVLLCWAILMALTPWASQELVPHMMTVGQVLGLLNIFFIGASLFGIIPLMIGAVMVADERKLGMWDWQLSLPASRARQWAVKLFFGLCLTALLSFIVIPLLWSITFAHLSKYTDYFNGIEKIRKNINFLLLPFLFMASAAFISSFSSDSYKSFFGGLLLGGTLVFLFSLSGFDNLFFEPEEKFITNYGGVILVGCTFLLLAIVSYRNFRFERSRPIRLLGQFCLIGLGTFFLAALAMFYELMPLGMVTDNIKDLPQSIQRKIDFYKKESGWVIEPMIAKRAAPGLLANRKRAAALADEPLLQHIYTDSNWDGIGAYINNGSGSGVHARIDLTTGKIGLQAFPILDRLHWEITKHFKKPNAPQSSQARFAHGENRISPNDNNTSFTLKSLGSGYFEQTITPPMNREQNDVVRLVQKLPNGQFKILDRQSCTTQYFVTADGKWFTHIDYREMSNLTIKSTQGLSTLKFNLPDGRLFFNHSPSRDNGGISYFGIRRFQASIPLRKHLYMPFIRTYESTITSPLHQKPLSIPYAYTLYLLDMEDFSTIPVCGLPIVGDTARSINRFAKEWRSFRDELTEGYALHDMLDSHGINIGVPPMTCDPQSGRIAILHEDQLLVWNYSDRRRNRPGVLDPLVSPYYPLQIDLSGMEINNMQFLDKNTILTWGDMGIFRIKEDH